MADTKTAWEDGRPIYGRLPFYGYQDNPLADALTAWVDSYLTSKKTQLENFYQETDPDQALDTSLDWLGWLVGYSGSYWDSRWLPEVKRAFIRESHSYLWRHRGTRACIERVLGIHSISYNFWQDKELLLSFPLSGTFGGSASRFFIRLPLNYARTSGEWQEAQRTLKNWSPACMEAKVVYERFYMGFSVIGDPMFSR